MGLVPTSNAAVGDSEEILGLCWLATAIVAQSPPKWKVPIVSAIWSQVFRGSADPEGMRVTGLIAAMLFVALGLPVASTAEAAAPADSIGLFNPATAEWFLLTATGTTRSFFNGIPGDLPLTGDWDCDGVDTPGVFRPTTGQVFLRNSFTTGEGDIVFFFGMGGDRPLVGDWNNDGCDTVGVYRHGKAYLRNSLDTGLADHSFYFGVPGDRPYGGDFNGNGGSTVGLHRESIGRVYIRQSLTGGISDVEFFYGIPGDQVVVGDWDGDGDDTVGMYRASAGRFYLSTEHGLAIADIEIPFGGGEFIPVAGFFG